MSSPDDPVVFRQDRRKLALAALAAAAFVALGVSYIVQPEIWRTSLHPDDSSQVIGWFCAPFFSLALLAIFAALVRPTMVRLAPEGVTISTVLRTYSRPWSAIGDFRIWRSRRTRMVVFNDATPAIGWLAAMNQNLTGATSSMPTLLPVPPEQLLAALETAKARWS